MLPAMGVPAALCGTGLAPSRGLGVSRQGWEALYGLEPTPIQCLW